MLVELVLVGLVQAVLELVLVGLVQAVLELVLVGLVQAELELVQEVLVEHPVVLVQSPPKVMGINHKAQTKAVRIHLVPLMGNQGNLDNPASRMLLSNSRLRVESKQSKPTVV